MAAKYSNNFLAISHMILISLWAISSCLGLIMLGTAILLGAFYSWKDPNNYERLFKPFSKNYDSGFLFF